MTKKIVQLTLIVIGVSLQTNAFADSKFVGNSGIYNSINILLSTDCEGDEIDKNIDGICGFDSQKCYISPFNSYGRQFVDKRIDGINQDVVFDVNIDEREIIGFMPKSRLASIEDINVDPFDLFQAYDWNEKVLNKWINWHKSKIQDVVSTASKHEKNNKHLRRFLCNSSWLTNETIPRLANPADWPSWAKNNLVDEVVLVGEWEKPDNKKFISLAHHALQGTSAKLFIALDTRRAGKAIDPLTQLLNLQGEKIDGVYVKVEDDTDLPRAQKFMKEVLPDLQFGLDDE